MRKCESQKALERSRGLSVRGDACREGEDFVHCARIQRLKVERRGFFHANSISVLDYACRFHRTSSIWRACPPMRRCRCLLQLRSAVSGMRGTELVNTVVWFALDDFAAD